MWLFPSCSSGGCSSVGCGLLAVHLLLWSMDSMGVGLRSCSVWLARLRVSLAACAMQDTALAQHVDFRARSSDPCPVNAVILALGCQRPHLCSSKALWFHHGFTSFSNLGAWNEFSYHLMLIDSLFTPLVHRYQG